MCGTAVLLALEDISNELRRTFAGCLSERQSGNAIKLFRLSKLRQGKPLTNLSLYQNDFHVPLESRVQVEDNKRLLAPITEDDLLAAVADLQRNKAGGEGGLNNDFYLDLAASMIPRLVTVCNDLLQGSPPPDSFLKAVVVPLRKERDSPNALDYRPISLLQTSYKLFAKVLATRLQRFLGRLIGETQQGLVHGRQMDRSVVMMLAQLENAIYDAFINASDSAGILLLDFTKAYDTVDRVFLLEVLRQFGFAPEFVDLMARLHEGTTAQFFVNGQYSSPLEVKSGIRQGCPLAPLLFILAAEFFALALQQDEHLSPRHGEHKFSAFVDDSTVFLAKSGQLPRVMKIVEHFGQISGLKVQPAKSKYIFLNKAILAENWCGIPVLPVGDTVRYLGYDVGFSDLSKVNWAQRIRSIHRRMATAEQAATTVRARVDLFNAIVMPAVLFPAKMCPPTKEVLTSLVNMQKQFLWWRLLKDDPSRHKLTPSLIFTPKQAGGLGLISVPVAIQAQRVKMSMLWLLSRHDVYREAWLAWMGFHGDEPAVTPRKDSKSRCQSTGGSRRHLFQTEVCAALAPTEAEQHERQELSAVYVPRLAAVAGQLANSATYHPRSLEKITVEVDLGGLPSNRLEIPELTAFWGTFAWADNPWIPDSNKPVLSRAKYDRIAVASIASLEIVRTHRTTYTVRVPTAPGCQAGHTIAKRERWLIAILLHSPRIDVGEQLGRAPQLQLRKPPRLTQSYVWSVEADSIVVAVPNAGKSTITLQQQVNGLNWKVVSQRNAKKDATKLSKHLEGVVFHAHPRIHGFPWQVPARTRNRNIIKDLKMQPKKQLRVHASPDLGKLLTTWEVRSERDDWIRGLQSQLPQQLWTHRNTLTNYQVWVAYRMAAQQLNLHYEGERPTDGCLLAQDVTAGKVTITHITWGCERAQQFWSRCVEHWLGHEISSSRLEACKSYISSRVAPPVSDRMRRVLLECYGKWNKDYEDALGRIWWSLCSMGYALLWQIRNQVVHEGKKWRAPQQLEYMWASCLRQISAVARSGRNKPATRTNGLRLQLTLDCYVAITIEAEPPDSPPAPAPWLKRKESALIKRLRKFQEAIN